MANESQLSNSLLNKYSFGIVPSSLMTSLISQNYPMFLINVAMIAPAVAGTLLLISRLINIFMLPIAGATLEKTNLKWGKYRSWIMLCPPLAFIFFILMVLTPNFSPAGKWIYLVVVFVLGHAILAFATAGIAAMFPILTPRPIDRIRLATRRSMGMSSGQILWSLIGVPIMVYFGFTTGNDARGFVVPIIIFGLLAVVGYLVIANALKPFDSGQTFAGRPTTSIMDMIKLVGTNKHLLVLLIAEVFRWTSRFLMTGFMAFNFRYVFGNMLMIATMMTASNLMSFACTYFGQPFALKFGRKFTYVVGNIVQMTSFIIAWLFFKENITMYVAMVVIGHIGYGPAAAQTTAFFADAADYAELKSGKSVKGLIMGLQQLPLQFGLAISGAIIGFGLAAIGFDAALQVLPTDMISNIFMIATLLPALFIALTVAGIHFYKLTDRTILDLRAANEVV